MKEFGLEPTTLLAILVIALIIIIYLTWMVRYKAKAKERLLIIEKNYNVDKLNEKEKKNNLLNRGIILISSSVGAIIGVLIISLFRTGIEDTLILLICIFLFSGIGMVIGNKLNKKK